MDQNVTGLPGHIGGDDDHPSVIAMMQQDAGLNPLTRYALAGLRRCWDDRWARWSYKYHLDGRRIPNEFRPDVDLYYSLNVLLGLAKVPRGHGYDVAHILASICKTLPRYDVRNGAWGMALWAAAELGLDVPAVAADRLRPIGGDPMSIAGWTAQDVGLSLSGVTAQLDRDRSWAPLARGLRDLLLSRFRGPGTLFRDSGVGYRRHIATFATQVYAALALYQFAAVTGDPEAEMAATRCVEKLIGLQGPHGEWPWFFLPQNDSVLDPYEVYSVHQHGMAPALLHHAVELGVAGARDALQRGSAWIFGQNLLGLSMLEPSQQMIYRSQTRRGVHSLRSARLFRSGLTSVTKSVWPASTQGFQVRREMRSYEFGWLLWSFADDNRYTAVTHHPDFQRAGEITWNRSRTWDGQLLRPLAKPLSG